MALEVSQGSDAVACPRRRWRWSSGRWLLPPNRPCARHREDSSARATSSRPSATSRPTPTTRPPSSAVLKFFYGKTIPTGSVYLLGTNGRTVDKLTACKKTGTGYNTPCIEGPEQDLGSAAGDSRYAQDTLYFTGVDPVMGRR